MRVVLVDDVLYRPHRARGPERPLRLRPPGRIELACLIDRGGRGSSSRITRAMCWTTPEPRSS
ncbi:MAG: hypothetical protein ACLT8E_01015 [Akkermansia sp.]